MEIAELENKNQNTKKAILILNESIILLNHEKSKRAIKAINLLGSYYFLTGFYPEAKEQFENSLIIAKQKNFTIETALSFENIAKVLWRRGKITEALEYIYTAISIYEELNNKENLFVAEIFVCNIYIDTKEYDKAYDIYKEMEKRFPNDEKKLAEIYRGRGVVSFYKNNFIEAREFYKKALDIHIKNDSKLKMGIEYGNIAETFEKTGDYKIALKYYFSALEELEKTNYTSSIIFSYYGIGRTYQAMGDFKHTHEYLQKSLDLANKTGEEREKPTIYQLISEAYAAEGNYEKAYFYHVKYSEKTEVLINFEKNRLNTELAQKYNLESIEMENQILKQKNLLANSNFVHERRTKAILMIGIFFLILTISIVLYQSYKRKKAHKELSIANKKDRQKSEQIKTTSKKLEQSNINLLEKNGLLEDAQYNINQSIEYASYIQTALLSDTKTLDTIFPENFILYKPKDVVSGDFYYFDIVKNNIIIAVGDCTGHGVPGGFMTMLALSLLDEIIRRAEIETTSKALEIMRIQVKRALKQDNEKSMKDGMDIAICSINMKNTQMQYAGANSPLMILNNGEMTIIKPDKQPVSTFIIEKPFTNHKINLKKNDKIYMFSDGFKDQFNEQNQRFKTSKFHNTLKAIQEFSMNDQKEILDDVFNQWKGEQEQIDDVIVVGIDINNILTMKFE